jgi:hypothetical protein
MSYRVQFRRGSEDNWSNVNPILLKGEIGYTISNNRFKIGDGVRNWKDLSYVASGGAGTVTAITAGTGLIGGTITSSGSIAIDRSVVMTLATPQTITNKTLKSPLETVIRITHSGGQLSLDLGGANDFYVILQGNVTNFTFANLNYDQKLFTFRIIFESTGINLVNWPGNCYWPNGEAPILSGSGKIDIVTVFTYDNGSSYYGRLEAKNLTA